MKLFFVAAQRALALGAFLLSVQACTFFQEAIGWKLARPSVKLKDLRVKNVNLQQLELELSLDVQNPNPFDLRFSQLAYALDYNQRQLAQGFYQPALLIPAREATLVKIPLQVRMAESYSLLQAYFSKPKTSIEIGWEATAHFDTSLGSVKVKFAERKNLN